MHTAQLDRPNLTTPFSPTLTELAAQWVTAKGLSDAAWEQLNEAELAAEALHPPRPAETILKVYGTDHAWAPQRAWLEENRHCRLLTLYDRWVAQCEAIYAAFGVPALNDAATLALRTANEISEQIAETIPCDTAEAALKFGILIKRLRDGLDEEVPSSHLLDFLGDLERLASAEMQGRLSRSAKVAGIDGSTAPAALRARGTPRAAAAA